MFICCLFVGVGSVGSGWESVGMVSKSCCESVGHFSESVLYRCRYLSMRFTSYETKTKGGFLITLKTVDSACLFAVCLLGR